MVDASFDNTIEKEAQYVPATGDSSVLLLPPVILPKFLEIPQHCTFPFINAMENTEHVGVGDSIAIVGEERITKTHFIASLESKFLVNSSIASNHKKTLM